MAGGSSQISRGSDPIERKRVAADIYRQRGIIDNLFVQSQDEQEKAVDAAIAGAKAYAIERANIKTMGQGMGASTLNGTDAYVYQNVIPQAMQMKAGIYGNMASQRAQSLEHSLQLLNQNASLGSYSKSKQSPNYLGSAVMGAAMLANPAAGLLAGLFGKATEPSTTAPFTTGGGADDYWKNF